MTTPKDRSTSFHLRLRPEDRELVLAIAKEEHRTVNNLMQTWFDKILTEKRATRAKPKKHVNGHKAADLSTT